MPDLTLLAVVPTVRCTNCDPGWPDYVGAASGLLGAAVAVVALALTIRSGRDARASRTAAQESAAASARSAAAAESELDLFKEEVSLARVEPARRAALGIELAVRASGISDRWPPKSITMDVGVRNTGDRYAERVAMNIVVPTEFPLTMGGDDHVGRVTLTAEHDVGRGPEPCMYWNAVLGPFARAGGRRRRRPR